jgi:hypothetical protein
MLLKIEILLIPLLANSQIFEISEDDHPRLVTDMKGDQYQKHHSMIMYFVG